MEKISSIEIAATEEVENVDQALERIKQGQKKNACRLYSKVVLIAILIAIILSICIAASTTKEHEVTADKVDKKIQEVTPVKVDKKIEEVTADKVDKKIQEVTPDKVDKKIEEATADKVDIKIEEVTVLFNSCGRYELLRNTIQSFIKMNTYPYIKIIVVENGPYNPSIQKLMDHKDYANFTWLILGEPVGRLRAIDKAFKQVSTEWIFYSQDDWLFVKPGFIEMSMAFLKQHRYMISMMLGNTTNQEQRLGFSFTPGLKRMIDYRWLQGGYHGLIYNKYDGNSSKLKDQQIEIAKYYKDNLTFETLHSSEVYIKRQADNFAWSEIVPFVEGQQDTVGRDEVTAVITSCNRYDLLMDTLKSFYKMNTYPIKKMIVVEDGPYRSSMKDVMSYYPTITWLIIGKRVGQLLVIDQAYKHVETEWIFHSEDDWEYIKTGFIEMQLAYLKEHRNVINMYLRMIAKLVDSKTLIVADQQQWPGFTFNPSLKRTADYKMLPGGYSGWTGNISYGQDGNQQTKISKHYKYDLHFKAAQPPEVYINHIGWGRHVTLL